ncbi:MAG: hypothetical protein NTX16_05335 [Actinobacteria bacterium]|nr:hypothetical protein [Actinomycetota bacterium]
MMLLIWTALPRFKEPDLKRLLRPRPGTMAVVAATAPSGLVVLFTLCVNAVVRRSMLLGRA